jgi:SHS2 domain-containing protein
MSGKFEIIDHTADTGIEIEADSWEDFFEAAAQGFIALSFGEAKPGQGTATPLELREDTTEDLVVDLLRYLLVRVDADNVRINDVRILHAWAKGLAAEVYESPIESEDEIDLHIKAVTYHGLKLKKEDGTFKIRVIFDI